MKIVNSANQAKAAANAQGPASYQAAAQARKILANQASHAAHQVSLSSCRFSVNISMFL
jgi:hypothetical protein